MNVKGFKRKGEIIYPAHPNAKSGDVIPYRLTPGELAEFNRKHPPKPTQRQIIGDLDRKAHFRRNNKIGVWW